MLSPEENLAQPMASLSLSFPVGDHVVAGGGFVDLVVDNPSETLSPCHECEYSGDPACMGKSAVRFTVYSLTSTRIGISTTEGLKFSAETTAPLDRIKTCVAAVEDLVNRVTNPSSADNSQD